MKCIPITLSSNPVWIILGVTIISLFGAKPTSAQNFLIPGYWGGSDAYEFAIKTVFKEVYSPHIRASVQFRSKYGIETVTGIDSDSTGYRLLHLVPEKNIWHGSWVEVPCIDPQGNELPKIKGKTCRNHDFSSADTILVNKFEKEIDFTLALKLIRLWEEMLVRSSYLQKAYMSTGGVTYQYSAFKYNMGKIEGYSRNPQEGTFTGEFAIISRLMSNVAKAESDVKSDSLINLLDISADKLLRELLQHGKKPPLSTQLNRTLKGCDTKYQDLFESNYCWQAYLTDVEIPNLILADNKTGEYIFEIVDLSDSTNIKRVPFLPVISIHNSYKNDSHFPGWQNYLLHPWDIMDLMTNTRDKEFQVFGYRTFTLKNETIRINSDTVIIHFDGLLSSRSRRLLLDIEGEHEWFGIKSLF